MVTQYTPKPPFAYVIKGYEEISKWNAPGDLGWFDAEFPDATQEKIDTYVNTILENV
ncbi:MAG: hypothetical protein LBR98_03300 [Syntrophomonadaceae bacterium]|nr:hypothetical protein [Syntrophomonadaceae bacterium]